MTAALILLLVVGLAAGGLVFATRREPSAPTRRRGSGGCALDPGAGRQHALRPGPRRPRRPRPAVRAVQRDVAELRDLEFERRVPVTVESPDKLAKRLLRALAEETDADELRRQGRAMELLGELPPGTDLPRLINRVQAESVLGFYLPGRPPKGGLYVRSSRGLDPYAKIILAHELTHAVTDQRFDLTRADRLAAATAREDELAAYSGLVEGDATLTMQRYLAERLTPAEQASAGVAAATERTPQRDAAPAVIRESMLFPYQEGLRFVRTLYQQGGWAAVNRAYRDPPTSTEQLLHPERYLGDRDQPQTVDVARPERPARRRLAAGDRAELRRARRPPPAPGRAGRDRRRGGRGRLGRRPPADLPARRPHRPGPADRLGLHRRGHPVLQRHARLGHRPLRPRHPLRRHPPLVRRRPAHHPRCRGPRVAWLSAPDQPTLNRLTSGLGSP